MRLSNYILAVSFFIAALFAGCKSDATTSSSVMTGDPEIDAITAQIAVDPDNAMLYFERSKKYYDKKSYDNTILDLQKAMMIDSLNPDFYHLLSDAFLDYYNTKGAMNAMYKVVSLYPDRIPSLLKLSELKYILEDYDGSILTANEVLRVDNQNAEAFFMLGNNFKALDDEKRAINSYQTAVEMDSGLTDAWLSLGEIYESKNDPIALTYYESAIVSNTESMEALHAKAYYLQNNKKIDEALKIYNQIILTDKNYTDAFLNSGLLYMELDSMDRAYEQFDIMVGIAPTNYLGFYMRGITLEKKGRVEDALKDYQSAFALNNKEPKIEEAIRMVKNKIK